MTHAWSWAGRGPQCPTSRSPSSSAITIGIERVPLVRYWSISSGFSSRGITRSSRSGARSTSLAMIGTVLDASPHQSSAITSSLRLVPGGTAAKAQSGIRAKLYIPCQSPQCSALHEATNGSNGSALSHNALKSNIQSPITQHQNNTFTSAEVPRCRCPAAFRSPRS